MLEKGGRIAIEWPADSGWWDLPEVPAFEREHCSEEYTSMDVC